MTTTADASNPGHEHPVPTPDESSAARPDTHHDDDPARRGPSVHTRRARRLLVAGAAGGLIAAAASVLGFGLGYGTRGAITAVIAASMVLFFYAAGQLVMVAFADAGARVLLLVSMMSYSTRVIVLGLVLVSYGTHRANWPSLVPTAMFVTTMAVVTGWLVVEVIVFSRLRIGAYDTEYATPPSDDSDGMSAQ